VTDFDTAAHRYQRGHDDGYRVGPDGIDPDGQRAATTYDPARPRDGGGSK
jgi:hypothetical protein